jgi:hypothetical protein
MTQDTTSFIPEKTRNLKPETPKLKTAKAQRALESGAATVRTAPVDSTRFVLSVRPAGDVGTQPSSYTFPDVWLPGWIGTIGTTGTFVTLGTCVSLKRFERSEAIEPFDRIQGRLFERLELAICMCETCLHGFSSDLQSP